jgi:imidazolonepropionase-like amidohydrolase
MKRYILSLAALVLSTLCFGQANILPSKAQSKPIIISHATIHTATGLVINNGFIAFNGGKITALGEGEAPSIAGANTIDASGKHVYPGFIVPNTILGLVEIELGARSTDDGTEVGEINPHVRSLIAFNTDSKVIPTTRSNGILMAQPTPLGDLIPGQSSVVTLDAWNWEDAAYKKDMAVHVNWPSTQGTGPAAEAGQKVIDKLNSYFTEAKAYAQLTKPAVINARFEALKGLFDGSKKLFVNVNQATGMLQAINFAKSFGLNLVLVGASEAYLVADVLKENRVPVIIAETQALPDKNDDDVYLPYALPKILQDAGVLVAIGGNNRVDRVRSLPFQAGTAAAYGLSKEQALALITLNTAKILGIDKSTGSLEVGKDATLFISGGDALDMLGNKVENAFIQGRTINLDNLHKQLYKRYQEKYGVK